MANERLTDCCLLTRRKQGVYPRETTQSWGPSKAYVVRLGLNIAMPHVDYLALLDQNPLDIASVQSRRLDHYSDVRHLLHREHQH
jgi:hypothetical protein